MQPTNQSNKKIFFLMAVFIVPMLVSFLLFVFHDHFHFKTTNHGTLLKDPIDVKYLTEGNPNKWQIVYVDNGACDSACEKISFQLHQIQKALGKESNRVHVVLLSDTYPQLKNLEKDLLQRNNKFAMGNKIYLVDPIGNLFMYYPDTTDPMNVLKDIKKVLEVSQIG